MLKNILKGAGFVVVFGSLFLLMVYCFMIIWNITIPEVFGLKSLSYGESLRILILARVLIGGFGFRWSNSLDKGRFWRARMKMKMQNMSEDEKAEFKRRLWQRCQD